MVHLDLTPDERDLLQSTLEACISDVRLEIRNTDRLEYKDELKRREAVFKKLLAALQTACETAVV